jgi:FAD/FMN-containing dehydrogenase
VRAAVAAGRHVRVVGTAHTTNSQLCTPGDVISTEKLNRIEGIEKSGDTESVTVEAGAKFFEVAEWLHQRDRSLGFAIIGYRGISVGGAIGTGAHGSSTRESATLASRIEAMWVVGADGELREYSAQNTDAVTWKALRANLGMLGVVVKLRLRVEPQFNLRVRTSFYNESRLFKKRGAQELIQDCNYVLVLWFPNAHRVMRACGTRTGAPAEAGATNTLLSPSVPAFAITPLKQVLQLGACHNGLSCLIEDVRELLLELAPPFMKKNIFGALASSRNVVGPSHHLLSSDLSPYESGFFQRNWEIAVPISKAQQALAAVRARFHKDHVCLPLVGVSLRVAPIEDISLIAHSSAYGDFKPGELAMFIELSVYQPTGFPLELQARYDAPYDEFGRVLLEDFSGRAHWGKNVDWLFELQRGLDVYGTNLDDFRQVADQMDPDGVFTNPFARNLGMDWQDPVGEAVRAPRVACGQGASPYLNSCREF